MNALEKLAGKKSIMGSLSKALYGEAPSVAGSAAKGALGGAVAGGAASQHRLAAGAARALKRGGPAELKAYLATYGKGAMAHPGVVAKNVGKGAGIGAAAGGLAGAAKGMAGRAKYLKRKKNVNMALGAGGAGAGLAGLLAASKA